MTRDIHKVVVLGANGAMGAGSGAVFAAANIPTVFLARTVDRARAGKARAEKIVKSEALARFITVGSYEADFEREIADADVIFEAVSEQLDLKRAYFERIDAGRRADAIVATVSSGLSIAQMCSGRSDGFRRHFLGIHFFNPPNVILGCELIPHAETDPAITRFVADLLRDRLGRALVLTSDTPAFCGNRVGFKVLNECAQLAEQRGAAYVDALIGPHTGRAMAPLATIDFVGWDVHKAIVDNLHDNTTASRDSFALPGSMARLIARGHLGDKTPELGGFYRRTGKERFVLDAASGAYVAATPVELPEVAARMKALHRVGRYREAFDVFAEATGDASVMRRVILGYLAYGLSLVGDVVAEPADVDRIMGQGFNWAPPSLLVDVIGARRTVRLLEAEGLAVPRVVIDARDRGTRLFNEPDVDIGKFFHA